MNLKDQCCTVEQALKLIQLGVTEEATFWHMPRHKGVNNPHGPFITYGPHSDAIAPAFNVSELGAMLPSTIDCGSYSWYHRHNWRGHSVGYSDISDNHIEIDWYPTEAIARAELLIKLLSLNLIKPM